VELLIDDLRLDEFEKRHQLIRGSQSTIDNLPINNDATSSQINLIDNALTHSRVRAGALREKSPRAMTARGLFHCPADAMRS
jgi:hypothetical protein